MILDDGREVGAFPPRRYDLRQGRLASRFVAALGETLPLLPSPSQLASLSRPRPILTL